MMLRIAVKSLLNRRVTVVLTMLALLVSLMVLFSVEHLRNQVRESFTRTVSGVDLIVGAPTGPINLLLSSVFRMGNVSAPVSWSAYQHIADHPQVAWAVPLVLGDSHKGYRVLGTSAAYFDHFHYGDKQPLRFDAGERFSATFDVVLGAAVAEKLGYQLGEPLVLSHGFGSVSFTHHDHAPFRVSGILAPTGTPVDETLHISLAGVEAMHLPAAAVHALAHDEHDQHDDDAHDGADPEEQLIPEQVSAVLLGLTSRIAVLQVQRAINTNQQTPLLAILPGVTLGELWQLMGNVEGVLQIISALVLASALLGLATMLLASMRERQREIAVLRASGAGPGTIFLLIQLEALLIVLLATILASVLCWAAFALLQTWLSSHYGVFVNANPFTSSTLMISVIAVAATLLVGCIPALKAYRQALHQQL